MSGLLAIGGDWIFAQTLLDNRSDPFRLAGAAVVSGISDFGGEVGRET
jgi:hypothetical protein